MNSNRLTIECKVRFTQARHGRKHMTVGDAPAPAPVPLGRIPRVVRVMALAIRFEALIQRGEVRDYADLARLGHITRARATQIMNLLNLAPDIQEELLFLLPTGPGRDRIHEWQIRPIAAEADWGKQRRLWDSLTARVSTPSHVDK